MNPTLLTVADLAALTSWWVWWACLIVVSTGRRGVPRLRDTRVWRVANRIGSELHPFIPVALVIDYVVNNLRHPTWWNLVGIAFGMYCWIANKNTFDDNDRWKKRGRRLLEKVTARGSKLVAVPVPVGGEPR